MIFKIMVSFIAAYLLVGFGLAGLLLIGITWGYKDKDNEALELIDDIHKTWCKKAGRIISKKFTLTVTGIIGVLFVMVFWPKLLWKMDFNK